MIDLISELVKVGAIIQIEYGQKSQIVKGKIIKMTNNSIALQKLEGGIVGIKGEEIISFDTIEVTSAPTEETKIVEKKTQDKNTESLTNLRINLDEKVNFINSTSFNDAVPLKPEDENIKKEKESKEDILNIQKVSEEKETNKKEDDKQLIKKAKQESKKTIRGASSRNLEDLGSLLGLEKSISNLREEENNALIREMGEIQYLGSEFGFIRDFKTNTKRWFAVTELLDSKNTKYSTGEYVVFTRSTNYAGNTAICIHKPMIIKDLLELVDKLTQEGKRTDANEVLLHIFSSYPDCHAAIEKQKEINKKYLITRFPNGGDTTLYFKAKKYNNDKNFEKAVEFYKKAIEQSQRKESAIKDLGMLYIQLAKKAQSENEEAHYREEAKKLMQKYRKSLYDTSVNLSYLENFYYSIRDFENFKKVVNILLTNADEELEVSRHVFLLNKLASVLIREQQIDQAKILLNKAINLSPESTGAQKLLEILETSSPHIEEQIESIISANEIEISSGKISQFILNTLEDYNDYVGIPQSAINKGRFTKDNLKSLRKLIEQFSEKEFAGRSSDRAKYLLTEGKLMQELEPEDTFRLRSVMARYCNDMAKIHTYNNSSPEVIRFFYNEAFALENKYDATVRQVAYYLLSNTLDLEKLSKEFSRNPSVEYALDLLLKNGIDIKIWNSILSMLMYNSEITANVLGKLYSKDFFYKNAVDALKLFGETNTIQSQEDFKNSWIRVIDNRKKEYKQIIRSIKSFENIEDIETMAISLNNELEPVIKPWVEKLDSKRINILSADVSSSLRKYHEASGFRAKELNYHEINTLLKDSIQEILDEPTKISYDALLPLLKEIKNMVDRSFEKFVEESKPTPSVVLLRSENATIGHTVPLQIEVSIDKDSASINNVKIDISNSNGIEIIDIGPQNPYNRSIEGGEKHIFRPTIKVTETIKVQGAATIEIICEYSTGGKNEKFFTTLALHLYNSIDFVPLYNPYASVAESGPLDASSKMFYGHKNYISGIVSAILDSESKQVIIYGQKRSGKSSVLNRVKQDLENEGAFCVLFSMGKIVRKISEFSFYYKILKTIKDELVLLSMDGEQVPEFNIPTKNEFILEDEDNPVETFSKYMRLFKLACKKTEGWKNRRLVVMIDEFTYMYGAIKMNSISNTIMQQWKAVTQDPFTQFSSVLVGQDVVPAFKNEPYARNPFGVIEDLRLTYLDPSDAYKLIVNPILNNNNESRYVGEAANLIMDYTACNPYYIQIFCANLVDYINEKKYKSITEADVTDVANQLTSGVQALDHAKFENLLNARETEEDTESIKEGSEIDEAIMIYKDEDVETVLRAIAKASENKSYANRSDLRTCLNIDLEDGIIKQLYSRDVIELKEKYQDEITHKEKYRFLKIKVRLYKEWLLKH